MVESTARGHAIALVPTFSIYDFGTQSYREATPAEAAAYFDHHPCAWRKCRARGVVYEASWRQLSSRRTMRVQHKRALYCAEHGRAFAERHDLELPT